jgi:iron complex outermembrane recepter protein
MFIDIKYEEQAMSQGESSFARRLLASTRLAPIALMGTVAVGVLSTGAGRAEDAQVEDVKVTARLREEKAQDVPLPVSVVGAKTQERERLERLQDFAQKVPNFVPSITNPRTSAMSIRGISGISGGADGSESAVGLIVDNVFYTHVGFQWADFVDLQSFEVARGPQGTLLGKNTTVGAVVIHTQPPSFTPSATFETSFASYNRITEKLNVTGPIIDDKLAGRVTFFLDKGDGWIRDQVSGESLNDNNRWGVRAQFLFVGDAFTDRLIFDRLRSDEHNNYSGIIGDSFPFWANGAPVKTFVNNLATRLHRQPFTFDPYRPSLLRLGRLDQRTHGLSNEINASVGDNTFTSIAAWREFVLHPNNATGNNLTDISSNAFDVTVDQYSLESRIASPKDQTVEWQVGNYILREQVWSYSHTDYGSQAAQWYLNNYNADPALLKGVQEHNDGKARTFSIAEFGQATWHINEKWALTGGLRDTYEIREGSDFGWTNASNPGQLAALQTAGGVTLFDTGGQTARNNSLSGLINPSYKYSDNVLLYGSVARGEKSGAINTAALPILDTAGNFKSFQPVITKPEVSWDYELGVKTNWLDGKFVLNGNIYWNDIYDFQSILVNTDYTDSTGVPLRKNYLGNIGHVRLRGLEVDGRWSPLERLWITFSGALTEARYINYEKAAVPADWGWPKSANVGGVGAPLYLSLSGQRITGGVSGNNPVAPYSFNVGFNYEHPLGNALHTLGGAFDTPVSLFTYANLSWKYKTQLSNPWSIYQTFQPSYSLINAGLGLKTDDDRYSLHLWVKNLFDERYVTARGLSTPTTGSSSSGTTSTFGDGNPRTFGGTLRVKLY